MHARHSVLPLAVIVLLAGCAGDPASPAVASATASSGPSLSYVRPTGEIVVTESDVARQEENSAPTMNWVLYTRAGAATGEFVVGPTSGAQSVPTGVGSLRLVTPTGSDKVFLFNFDHVGTALASIDALAYSTFRAAGDAQQVAALNIQVDVNGSADGGFTTLVFEPVYNTAQGAVVNDAWQAWDAHRGGSARWWSTREVPSACAFDCFVAWSDIVASNPHAVIIGGFGINQGSGNPALNTAVDRLTIGAGGSTFVYDFEPIVAPTTREACKDGGWQAFQDAAGPMFTNQGQCVSYVQSGR